MGCSAWLHRLCVSAVLDLSPSLHHLPLLSRLPHTGLAAAGSLSNSGAPAAAPGPLVCEDGAELLKATPELDYLTHLVFRMYENKSVPPDAPGESAGCVTWVGQLGWPAGGASWVGQLGAPA